MPASLRLHHTKVITALALDPKEERLAAGDATGRILLWHGFAAAADAAAQRGFAAAAAAALGAGAAPAGDGNAVRVVAAGERHHGCISRRLRQTTQRAAAARQVLPRAAVQAPQHQHSLSAARQQVQPVRREGNAADG
jgi:hypothetical protein